MPNLLSLGSSPAHSYACRVLEKQGFVIEKGPTAPIHGILMDVPTPPSMDTERIHRNPDAAASIPVFCGNLQNSLPSGFRCVDLLRDPEYIARNADITARCAIRVACGSINRTLLGLPVLVIGWGRIGKCLARLLNALGADCRVFARKAEDRAMLTALGYRAVDREGMLRLMPSMELVINTAPEPVLDEGQTDLCPGMLMDLASKPGILGDNVIRARGLPGRIAPESSGELIAQTVIRLWKEAHP